MEHLLQDMDVIVSSNDLYLDNCAVMYRGSLIYQNQRISLSSYIMLRQCDTIVIRRRGFWRMLDKYRSKLARCSISYPLSRYFRDGDLLISKITKNKAVFRKNMFKVGHRNVNSLHDVMAHIGGCCKVDQFLFVSKLETRNLGELVPVLTIL